ncbi:hypothetical protein BVU17_03060 [Haloarcula taiwanensis]|uniref:DUF4013 domain-containing protein n=1 Tax=Haloarcula taiwanensis TaxID=1932004 RepID=A0A2H5A271_9EURY|nr:hypothetical protein BVU17_03060 [Haloarcula taiwanensis]RLM37295.1 DUF4013 domain-containing protein [Haloarcula sp. Atlit-120R]RLM45224.1 DUF4013 domain-containing protein [Haloarcula sp. Atlit-47R]RLN02005.1 DUF4013 domain-containing protein [Haloarcula sp. Atlit-7R]
MESLEDTLRYPMEDDDWTVTILIGGVLSLLSFLVVPVILVYGYLVQAVRERADGATQPPAFEDWGELLVDGLKAWAISIVYMLVPLVVFGVTVGGSLFAIATGTRAGAGAGLAGLFGGLAISFVLSLVFGYVATAGIIHFACTGEFGAGFDFGTLRTLVLSPEYATPWLVSIALFIAVNVVVNLLNVIPFLGSLVAVILSPFATFYVLVVATDLWAGGYNAALDDRDEPESVGTATA